jgi:poly(3-hydroxybutyrate) depolymerase
MARRKSPLVSALFKLTRAGVRQSTKIGKAATRQGIAAGGRLASSARHVMSGIATPADAPAAVTGGRWHEGRWGLGPLAMRRYRLFIPTGASTRRPIPLLLLLHGCAQDTAAFAASTRCATVARERGFAVLMPEQAQEANPQRCWNWFGSDARVGMETRILMAIVDHAVSAHPRIGGPLFAIGLSAGGSMALTLGLEHPERFVAVGSHSGAAPHSAVTPLQAGQTMRGRRSPDAEPIARALNGRAAPPLLLIHGDFDPVVSFANAETSAGLWADLLPEGTKMSVASGEIRRGSRRRITRQDWKVGRQTYVRLLRVHGLGHAWSGGAAGQAFSDPDGPDALRLAWQFFAAVMERAADKTV